MFPLQATMFFSNNRAVFNGSVFARVVWSCFSMLDHEERWRAYINLTSYQRVLGRGSQGGFVPHVCQPVQMVSFSIVWCFALSTVSSLSCPLLCYVFDFAMLSCDFLSRSTGNHSNMSGTNLSVTVTATLLATNIHSCMDICCHVLCFLTRPATNNHKLSHGNLTVFQQGNRT